MIDWNSLDHLLFREDPTTVLLLSNDQTFVRKVLAIISDRKVILATSESEVKEKFEIQVNTVRKLTKTDFYDQNLFTLIWDMVYKLVVGRKIGRDEVLLIIGSDPFPSILLTPVRDLSMLSIIDQCIDVDEEVLHNVLTLGFQIVREGNEGHPAGALFIIGDSKRVMKQSRALILNPFKGFPAEDRSVLKKANWETIKAFASLDGAVIIDKGGSAVAAGRYIAVDWNIYIQGGMGARHLAGASISKITGATAVVVSSTGTVSIYTHGDCIQRINPV